MSGKTRLLGDFLVEQKLITREQLEKALQLQQKDNRLLGQILAELGYLAEDEILSSLSEQLKVEIVTLKAYHIPAPVLRLLPGHLAYQFEILPIFATGNKLFLAMSNPLDLEAIDAVSRETHLKVEPVLARKSDIIEAIQYYYSNISPEEKNSAPQVVKVGEQIILSGESLAIDEWFNHLLNNAIENLICDISFEFHSNNTKILLHNLRSSIKENVPEFISDKRIRDLLRRKSLSFSVFDSGVFKGYFYYIYKKKLIHIYFSGFEAFQGVMLRIKLHHSNQIMLSDKDSEQNKILTLLQQFANKCFLGCIVAPKRNGKTILSNSIATYYCKLEKRVVLIQDNPEIKNPDIVQIVLSENEIQWRSLKERIKEQNPEIIIFDCDITSVTIKNSLELLMEGYTVFMTFSFAKKEMFNSYLIKNVDPDLFSKLRIAIIKSSLIPKLCNKCKEVKTIKTEWLKDSDLEINPQDKFYIARGCEVCRDTGYQGQVSVIKIDLLNFRNSDQSLEQQLKKQLFSESELFKLGFEKARVGEVALDDIIQIRC